MELELRRQLWRRVLPNPQCLVGSGIGRSAVLTRRAKSELCHGVRWNIGGTPKGGSADIAKVNDFHTSTGPDGAGKLKYHNQSEYGYGKEIIKNGHKVTGRQPGDSLCETCKNLA